MSETKPHIWAHRGARSLAPENTLAAGRLAAKSEAYGWEFDVRMTSDGELVLMHDLSLCRTTDIGVAGNHSPEAHQVTELTLQQVSQLSAGGWFLGGDPFGQIAAGAVSWEQAAGYTDERVPSLDQALGLTRDTGLAVNIEIKDMEGFRSDNIVERVATMVMADPLPEGSILSSFSYEYLVRFRELCPGFPVGYLVREITPDSMARARALDVEAFHPDYRHLTRQVVQHVLDAGFQINVFTVNEPNDIKRLAEWGVTGIITDFPARALAIVGA